MLATLEAFHDPSKNCPCHNQAEMLSVLHGQCNWLFSSSEVITSTDRQHQKGRGRKGHLNFRQDLEHRERKGKSPGKLELSTVSNFPIFP